MMKYAQGGIYKAEMGQPPVDVDGASAGMGMKRPKNMAGSKRRPTEAEKKQATKKMAVGGKAYAKGGYVRNADGCAIKGKTKGKEIKMAKGGKTC